MSLMEDSDIVKFHRDVRKALCIKDGFMQTGGQFSIKDEVYEYYISRGLTLKYNVKTERSYNHNHSMTEKFFFKYFIADFKHHEHIPLEDDLFEI